MKRLLPLLFLVLTACPTTVDTTEDDTELPPAQTFALIFDGFGYEAGDGLTIKSSVVQDNDGTEVATGDAVIANGVFAIDYGPSIIEREGYTIFYYIDTDVDGACIAVNDQTGYAWFGAVSGDVELSIGAGGTQEPDERACEHI